jgi:hypothetical protein
MQWKTTLALLVLVTAGALLVWYSPHLTSGLDPAPVADQGTLAELARLDAKDLTLIDIRKGDRVTRLERKPGGEWTMPGNWPVRSAEAEALAQTIAGLRSRFEPLRLDADPQKANTELAAKGLLPPVLSVEAASPDHTWHIALGEEHREHGDQFVRPTYLRLDDRMELVRLAPGLVGQLDRPPDYYQQRRLFPGEHVAREGENRDRAERLVARALRVQVHQGGGTSYALVHKGDSWELHEPVRDRIDTRARDALLAAIPDLWAEDFITQDATATAALALVGLAPSWPHAVSAAYWTTPEGLGSRSGLDAPQREIAVTREDGRRVTLQIGRPSGSRAHKVLRQPPPGMPPGMQPSEETVFDEYRYARLKDNPQVFEIRADRLKDVFVPLDTLRDARVVPIESADARRVDITHAGQRIVLQKDKDHWKLIEPVTAEADATKVTDLLGKLSGLQARDKDMIDHADPKAYGLANPTATIVVRVEEETKDARGEKLKKDRTVRVKVGRHDVAAKKLYLMVDDWPRINAVEDSLESLVERPAVAYRGKRVFDFVASDLARMEIHRGSDTYTLERTSDGWRLSRPVAAEADTLKADQLAGSLGSFEVLDYVDESPRPAELQSRYGLAKPALVVRLQFTDKTKAQHTLEVGKPRGAAGPGRYARLVDAGRSGPVFVLPDEVATALDRDSLAYRPSQLWQFLSEDVTSLRFRRQGEPEYTLSRDGAAWNLTGPFTAAALPSAVQELVNELASPHVASYKSHDAKDLAPYGLDRPRLEVTLTGKDGTGHTLLLGKPADKDGPGVYGKVASGSAVFVVGDAVARAADHSALDLLDPVLLRLDVGQLQRVQSRVGDVLLTLEHKGDIWRVTQGPGAPFDADADAMASLKALWPELRAQRFADNGSKVDWAKYGLDRPAARVTVAVAAEGGRPATHTVEVGGYEKIKLGTRYARVDHGTGVAVLSPDNVSVLTRTHLDYVNHKVWTFDAAAVQSLRRQAGGENLELVRKDGGWQMIKPADERVDDRNVQELLTGLGGLRALSIAAYPAADLHAYGLDNPAGVITLRLGNSKPGEHVLRVGKPAGGKTRYAQADGSPAVVVLPPRLCGRLLAPPVAYRDHNIAHFVDADRIRLERGPRRATFARVDGTWKLTEPLQADAEHDELEGFVATLARLRADELVAQGTGPEALKKYGLERPEVRWRLYAGGKEVLDLLVGNEDEDGDRRYARLAGSDVVFMLDPKLSTRVMGEFRPRSVWSPAVDAVQVESLRYDYPGNPFTLQKTDDTWHVVGRRDLKVNAEAVNDTLAALANLKLARYVVDQGADLKLFRLDQPYLVLEVTTRSGKRTLQVGNTEGGTKRRYARVPATDRTDVFVLDDADCARILRDAAGFTRPTHSPSANPAK